MPQFYIMSGLALRVMVFRDDGGSAKWGTCYGYFVGGTRLITFNEVRLSEFWSPNDFISEAYFRLLNIDRAGWKVHYSK